MPRKRCDRQSDRQTLEEFLGALSLEGRSAHSVPSYRRDPEAVLAALPRPLGEVKPADLRECFRRQQQAGRSPSSINRAIAAVRSFFRFLWEEGRLESNPAQALRSIRLGPPLAPKHLTVPEVQRLLSLPDIETPTGRRDRAILMLLYNTGLRVGELCALNREDVRLPAEGWGALQVVGKGRRLRRLPVNRPTADALLAYLVDRDDAEPALFLNRNRGRFNVRGIASLVNRYLRAAGIANRSGPHLLRHTFATHALRARPNLRAVQELLGHAWVTTTQRYTHLEVEDLQAQVANLPANGCDRVGQELPRGGRRSSFIAWGGRATCIVAQRWSLGPRQGTRWVKGLSTGCASTVSTSSTYRPTTRQTSASITGMARRLCRRHPGPLGADLGTSSSASGRDLTPCTRRSVLSEAAHLSTRTASMS